MKTMIAALAVCGLVLTSAEVSAQNSGHCLQFKWEEEVPLSNGTIDQHFSYTNNCSWTVNVYWIDNGFGKDKCHGSVSGHHYLEPGRTYKTKIFQVTGRPDIRYCAEAAERGHPDYNTCPSLKRGC